MFPTTIFRPDKPCGVWSVNRLAPVAKTLIVFRDVERMMSRSIGSIGKWSITREICANDNLALDVTVTPTFAGRRREDATFKYVYPRVH